MSRILADIPDEDIKWLDQRAAEQGKSRASVLREAVASYKAQADRTNRKGWIERGAGYWAGRDDIGDGVEYQRAIREDRTSYDEI